MQRVVQGLGIAGGIMGLAWGVYGPVMRVNVAWDSGWYMYDRYLPWGFFMVIGVILSLAGIAGALLVHRSLNASRVLLLAAGALGFFIGPAWLWPGLLLLVAGGLAVAVRR